jgi:hypothetical protein
MQRWEQHCSWEVQEQEPRAKGHQAQIDKWDLGMKQQKNWLHSLNEVCTADENFCSFHYFVICFYLHWQFDPQSRRESFWPSWANLTTNSHSSNNIVDGESWGTENWRKWQVAEVTRARDSSTFSFRFVVLRSDQACSVDREGSMSSPSSGDLPRPVPLRMRFNLS